jgi:arginase
MLRTNQYPIISKERGNLMKEVAIVGAPLAWGQTLEGVAKTPEALRQTGLHQAIINLGLTVKDVGDLNLKEIVVGETKPGQKIKHAKVVGEACRLIAEEVTRNAAENDFCLTIGGDHSVAFGSITGILRAHPDTALVWVDAHGDFNTPDTSPSGNLHGMPLSALMGYARTEIEGFEWMDTHISRDRVALVGLRSVDEGERKLLREAGITVFTMTDIDREGIGAIMRKAIAAIDPDGERFIHLSYDIDAIDPSEAPGTGTRVRGGLSYREAHYIAESLAETGRLGSMDIVEINPDLDSDDKRTLTLGVELVTSALGKRIL